MRAFPLLAGLLALVLPACGPKPESDPKPPVRVAIIGGMTMSGMWQALAEQFTNDTGWPVELVASGPKDTLQLALEGGTADLVTLHASDEAAEMVASGLASKMQPWARNELGIIGPAADPAGIRGMTDGAAALRKIAETQSNFVDFRGTGSRGVAHRLWTAAGVEPHGDWVIKDESDVPQLVVQFAEKKNAYVIVGIIPMINGRIPSTGMEIMVQGDPAMRRPYVVMVANEVKFPACNAAGAKALHRWMTGKAGQTFLRDYGQRSAEAEPLFFPIDPPPPS